MLDFSSNVVLDVGCCKMLGILEALVLLFEFCYTCFQLSITKLQKLFRKLVSAFEYNTKVCFDFLTFSFTWPSYQVDIVRIDSFDSSITWLQAQRNEVSGFFFVTDSKFMNLTIDTANETHLGAIKWRAMEKLLTLSVSPPKWLCKEVPSFISSKF